MPHFLIPLIGLLALAACTMHEVPHKESKHVSTGFKIGKPYTVHGRTFHPLTSAKGYDEVGLASWYGPKFHGGLTANGERYDMHALTAAHRTLPLPTMVEVTNLENGRSVIVRVNDRGPFADDRRIIDLSYAAAKALGIIEKGTARVRVRAIEQNDAPIDTKGKQAYVQVGAFSSYANAMRMKQRLSTNFAHAVISPSGDRKRPFWRVRLGPFRTLSDLQDAIAQLQRLGLASPIIVVE